MAADANAPAASTGSAWRKRLLVLFVLLATAGLAIGLVAAFKPDVFRASSKAQDDPATTAVTPVTPNKEIEEPVVTGLPNPMTPVAPVAEEPKADATPTTTTPAAAPTVPTVIKNSDLLSGLLNAQTGSLSEAATRAAGDATSAMDKQKEAFLTTIAKATTAAGATTTQAGACAPEDGLALRTMLEDPSACTVITLRPGVRYNVAIPDSDDDITISSRKVVIGNPIALPTIDGSDCKRIFHVVAGGSLDLQFVRTFRGGGELIATIPVLRGGTALIELGGRFNAFGVIFTNAPPAGIPAILIAPDLSRAVRVFGGQIFNAGGVLTISLSHFWVLQPGVLLREIYIVGADVLSLSGAVILSGCTFTNSQLFIIAGGVGVHVAVLGGVFVASGCTFTLNFAAVHASGAGILTFIGGGVGIFSGVSWTANLGLLAHFGSGIMIFNGGGVLVISGATFSVNLGVAIECGTGIMISLGGGTLTATGIAQDLAVGVDFYAGAGVLNWVGAGSAVLTGFSESRSVGTGAIYGIGGSMAVGAGTLVVVGAPNADSFGVASAALVGGDWFVGAGILVEVGSPFVKNAGVLWATFIGIEGFVGAGTAVVAYSPHKINLGKAWINKGAALYHVNGAKVSTNLNAYWVDKDGVAQPLKNAQNKTRLLADEKAAATATTIDIIPQAAAFNVLQGRNAVNDGTPSPFVAQIQASAVGKGMEPLDVPFASVNGATTCNACGFQGDVATEFIGDAAGVCAASEAGQQCDLSTVKTHDNKLLPQWITAVTSLYDKEKDTTAPLNTQVITAVLRLGCSRGTDGGCLPAKAIEGVVAASLDNECARLNLAPRDLPKHTDLAADVPVTTEPFTDVAHTSAYDLGFTTHDKACTDAVTAWIKDTDAAALLKQLQAADPAGATQLEAVDVALGTIHTVPGLSLAAANQQAVADVVQAAAATGLPTVLVTPSTAAAASTATNAVGRLALPSLQAGETGQVTLAGFAAQQPVALEMTERCLLGARDVGVAVGSFTPSKNGTPAAGEAAVAVPITIPAGTAPGTYSIRASQNGLSWCSQPVEVRA